MANLEKEIKIVLVVKRIDKNLIENHSQEISYQIYPLEVSMDEKTEQDDYAVNEEVDELFVSGIVATKEDVVVVVSSTY